MQGFSDQWSLNELYSIAQHSQTHLWQCQPRKVTASLSRAVRVRCLAQRHLDAQPGGAGARPSNLKVTSQPPLPP